MSTESITLATALFLGFFHTVIGPDHYLPFVVLSKARGWGLSRTIFLTLACGMGHVLSSVAIGTLGLAYGWGITKITILEEYRGSLAGWSMILFGLVYTGWGVWRIYQRTPHKHHHRHAKGDVHVHEHIHVAGHDHVHNKQLTPWVLFVIFVLGPCEAMIPLFAFHAVEHETIAIILTIAVFSVATVCTMLVLVVAGFYGLRSVKASIMEKYAHALAGTVILLSGLLIEWL